MSPVSYIPGFSDFFAPLARGDFDNPATGEPMDDPTVNALFDQLRDAFNAKTLRFVVWWEDVDTMEQGQHVISYAKYDDLVTQAVRVGFKLLPVVWGAPRWWTEQERLPTPGDGTPGSEIYYPAESKISEFGTFVANTLSHFAGLGVCRAVEVCNEPNRPKWEIPAPHYKLMLYSALESVIARSYPFEPTYKPTVISGGLSCNPKDENDDGIADWEQYLAEILNQCPPTLPSGEFFHPAVGIHPYDTKNHSGSGDPVADFVAAVTDKWNATIDIATANDIWITEFGCTAKASFGFSEERKKEALRRLLNASDGFFTTRSRCKAVLLYRYLPQSVAVDDQQDNPYWDSVPMLDDDLLPKQPVADMLKTNWLNAPS